MSRARLALRYCWRDCTWTARSPRWFYVGRQRHHGQKFEQAIAAARESEPSPDVHPLVHQAMTESLESELSILREQLDRYEALGVSLDRLQDVADALRLEIEEQVTYATPA